MTDTQQKLLTYLGSCIFETDDTPRLTPNSNELEELFKVAERFKLDTLLLYYYRNIVPVELLRKTRVNFLTIAGSDVKHLRSLAEVEKIFNSNNIDYLPLKGSYLIKDIYPDSTLRLRVDVDLLVREKDKIRAFNLLLDSGWEAEHGFIHLIGTKHMPELRRENWSTIEIHSHLFDEENENENEMLWKHIDNNDYDELLLAYLLKHSFFSHDFENGVKTIIDIGYTLKNRDIDYKKLSQLEQKLYNFEFMPIVISSFKEFFPKEIHGKFKTNNIKLCKIIREQLFQDLDWSEKEKESLKIKPELGGKGLLNRIFKILQLMHPSQLGKKFNVQKPILIYCFYPYYFVKLLFMYFRYGIKLLSFHSTDDKRKYIENITQMRKYYISK